MIRFQDLPVSQREDILDDLIMYSRDDVPVISRIGSTTTVRSTNHQWELDRREDRGQSGIAEGFGLADLRPTTFNDKLPANNVTQIFTGAVEVTETMQELAKKGAIVAVRDMFARESYKKLQKVVTDIEWAVLNNTGTIATASPRRFAGLFDRAHWITAYAASPEFQLNRVAAVAGTGLLQDKLVEGQVMCFNDGKMPVLGIMSPNAKISLAGTTTAIRRVNPENTNRTYTVGIDMFSSDMGDLELVMSRDIPVDPSGLDQALLCDPDDMNLNYLHGLRWKMAGTEGDRAIGWWRAELTKEWFAPWGACIIDTLSY